MHPYPRGPLSLPLICLAAVPLGAQAPRGVPLFDAGDWAGAKAELSATIRRNDRDARAHYHLGRLAMLDDDVDAAAAQFERTLALDQTVSDHHMWYGTALSQQAGRASKLKQPFIAKRVLSEFERAVALDPRSIEAHDSPVDFYSMAPGFMGGGTDKARDQAQALARIRRGARPPRVRTPRNRREEHVDRRARDAGSHRVRARHVQTYSVLAKWYAKDKRWPEAFAALEGYIKKHPEDPFGPYGIGRSAALSGQQLDRGEQGIRAFIAKPPKHAGALVLSGAWRRLGLVLAFQGKRAEARSAIEQALTLDPRNEEAKKATR